MFDGQKKMNQRKRKSGMKNRKEKKLIKLNDNNEV